MQTDKKTTIDMKFIRLDILLDAWVLGRFSGWGESKMKLILNIVMLHIKLREQHMTAT